MEPIPETDQALTELERFGNTELRPDLERLTSLARERVPELVGVSLALVAEDLVLTYVASDSDIAALDGIQYVDDGPCVESVRADQSVVVDVDAVMDEARWLLFAQASAAAGIRSTLSIPFRDAGVVTGGVNLYGSGSRTFDGHVDEMAMVFGAWAPGAVANADLSFQSRLEAVRGPARLKGQAYVDQAIGLVMSARGLTADSAEARLEKAAAQAGISVAVLARALVEAYFDA